MIGLSGQGACCARAVVRSANWTVFSVDAARLAPPAIATVNKVTTASRTMLQSSSRILMRGIRARGGVVPAGEGEKRWLRRGGVGPVGQDTPAPPVSLRIESSHRILRQINCTPFDGFVCCTTKAMGGCILNGQLRKKSASAAT